MPQSTRVIACAKPDIDPKMRLVAPVALAGLLVFALIWGAISSSFAYQALQADQFATEVRAKLIAATGKLRYSDASGANDIDPPRKWRNYLEADNSVRLRIVQGSGFAPTLAANARFNLIFSTVFLLITPLLFFLAFHTMAKLRADTRRRDRLRSANVRLSGVAFRSVGEIVGNKSKRRYFRVLVTFFAPDGRSFEAVSDYFNADPTETMQLAGLEVLFDPQDPQQSMVAPDCLAVVDAHRAIARRR